MREIDTRYESGDLTGIDQLEEVLEATLEALDAALWTEAEDYDAGEDLEPDADLEPDPHEGCSIEEQLVRAYDDHIRYPWSFPVESLRASIHDAFFRAQLGGMTPSGFRENHQVDLVLLAGTLHRERMSWGDRRARKLV